MQLSPSVRLLATPGDTPQDITTIVGTPDGIAALTHLWWTEEGPYSLDRDQLREQRERVLDIAALVVCAHGPAFRPGASTPR